MRLRHVLATVLLAAAAQPLAHAQPSALEYDIKAAFILNFTRYVEWPAARRTPPFHICVYRQNPFGARLAAMVADERWQDGAIQVDVVTDLRRLNGCHLLYVPAAATEAFAAARPQWEGRSVLTVGEHMEFLQQGGMIQLFVEQNKVRFSINQRTASTSGLQISSRLLRLARAVVGVPGDR